MVQALQRELGLSKAELGCVSDGLVEVDDGVAPHLRHEDHIAALLLALKQLQPRPCACIGRAAARRSTHVAHSPRQSGWDGRWSTRRRAAAPGASACGRAAARSTRRCRGAGQSPKQASRANRCACMGAPDLAGPRKNCTFLISTSSTVGLAKSARVRPSRDSTRATRHAHVLHQRRCVVQAFKHVVVGGHVVGTLVHMPHVLQERGNGCRRLGQAKCTAADRQSAHVSTEPTLRMGWTRSSPPRARRAVQTCLATSCDGM